MDTSFFLILKTVNDSEEYNILLYIILRGTTYLYEKKPILFSIIADTHQ